MKTPDFWFRKSFLAKSLYLLGKVYDTAVQCRRKKTSLQVPVPVICIGNVVVGGSGKTPTALAVADIFADKKVVFLNHGYKSERQNVFLEQGSSYQKGLSEEAFLLCRRCPTVINRNRKEGALTALTQGAELLIMDDGFQNPGIVKDFSLLIFDGHLGIGNGYVMPAGPMRESLEHGLKYAKAVLIVGKDETHLTEKIHKISPVPVFSGKVKPLFPPLEQVPYVAFAGIGQPNKFFAMLESNGLCLKEKVSFPDHVTYSEKDIEKLKSMGNHWITTEKDWIKLPKSFQSQTAIVPIVMDIPQALQDLMKKELIREDET